MLVLIGLTACNNNETTTPEPANVDSNNTAEQTDIASHNSINTLADAMNNFVFDLEDMQLSGDADADFAQVIIRHHTAGTDMAKVELSIGTDTVLKALAHKIIKRQQKEIESLDHFLNTYQPQSTSDLGKKIMAMVDKSKSKTLPMHGAIVDLDFTTMMLLHHLEGVNMAKEYLKNGEAKKVIEVANEIVEIQPQEIEALKKWKNRNHPNRR